MESNLCSLLNILDNTFVGTLSAGILLAILAVGLYRIQKDIDARYEKGRKLGESASNLFANIEIAYKFFEGQLNAYDSKVPQVKAINALLNASNANHFHLDAVNKSNIYFKEIDTSLNDLISRLKMEAADNQVSIEELTKDVSTFGIYLVSIIAFPNSSQVEIDDYRNSMRSIYTKIQDMVKTFIW
jgi:hypothetical protein